MNLREMFSSLTPRARILVATALVVVSLAVITRAVRPVSASIAKKRQVVAANERILASLARREGPGSTRPALPPLAPLSAAPIVQELTELAHAVAIRRVNFVTGEAKALDARAAGASGTRVGVLPLRVDLETSAGTFAAYLDALSGLAFPVRVERFEMRRQNRPGAAVAVRLELLVYGVIS